MYFIIIIKYLFKFAWNTIKSLFIFIKIRPKAIVTTGTHTAVPMCLIGKLLGAKIIFIENKKKVKSLSFASLLIVITLAIYFKNYLNPFQKVTFLNVYQGDCIVIQDSFAEKVMLIDTGGQINYDIANKKIIPYLS